MDSIVFMSTRPSCPKCGLKTLTGKLIDVHEGYDTYCENSECGALIGMDYDYNIFEAVGMKLWDFLPEFIEAFEAQLRSDDVRWGDTWLHRSPEGQEERLFGDVTDYFDKFKHGNEPMPFLKVIGNAYICWVRELKPNFFDSFREV